MKYLKYIFLTLLLFFTVLSNISAITINDYINDLNKLKEEKRAQEEKDEQTQAKIAAAKQRLEEIKATIIKATKDIEVAESDIEKLESDIAKKEEQIKDLVSFLQISDSENFYLKYIFGAEDFTDLIYRISVIEQLTTKSDELIDEMNIMIEANEQKIKELETKKIELNKLNEEVLKEIDNLGEERNKYFDEVESIDEQITSAEKQIKFYRDLGCKDNEDISECTSMIPSSSGFIRPTKSGRITDNYGWRADPCPVCSPFHRGIDIGGNREGTTVMASAAGKVVAIDFYSCGGKVVTLDHNINGKQYATRYYHLLNYNVKLGDIVSQGQKIGEVGGGNTAYYDQCSTGAHLHFSVVKGHYNASTYMSKIVDPRNYVDFPKLGIYW